MRIRSSQSNVRRFAQPQKKYIEAKGEYDLRKSQFDRLRQPLDHALDQGTISDEEWAQKVTALEFECGIPDAQSKLNEAEHELVEWARQKLDPHMTEKQRAEIAIVWEKWLLPNVRDKVIDLCMRLEDV